MALNANKLLEGLDEEHPEGLTGADLEERLKPLYDRPWYREKPEHENHRKCYRCDKVVNDTQGSVIAMQDPEDPQSELNLKRFYFWCDDCFMVKPFPGHDEPLNDLCLDIYDIDLARLTSWEDWAEWTIHMMEGKGWFDVDSWGIVTRVVLGYPESA